LLEEEGREVQKKQGGVHLFSRCEKKKKSRELFSARRGSLNQKGGGGDIELVIFKRGGRGKKRQLRYRGERRPEIGAVRVILPGLRKSAPPTMRGTKRKGEGVRETTHTNTAKRSSLLSGAEPKKDWGNSKRARLRDVENWVAIY